MTFEFLISLCSLYQFRKLRTKNVIMYLMTKSDQVPDQEEIIKHTFVMYFQPLSLLGI